MAQKRRDLLGPAAVVLTAALALPPARAAAQEAMGTVRDATSGELLSSVEVVQERAGEVVFGTHTSADGRFRIALRGQAPFTLVFNSFGYDSRTLEVSDSTVSAGPLTVELSPAPYDVGSIGARVDRPELKFWFNDGWLVTEHGIFGGGDETRECTYFVLDSVVIRDPRLYTSDALEYEPASYIAGGASSVWLRRSTQRLRDPRLLRDAAPCGVTRLLRHSKQFLIDDRPESVPIEPASVARVVESHALPAAGAAELFTRTASGELAFASRDRSHLYRIDLGSGARASLDLEALRSGLRADQVGWRGDTVWAVDLETRLLVLWSDTAALVDPRGLPSTGETNPPAPLSEPWGMDLPVHVPAGPEGYVRMTTAPEDPFTPQLEGELPGRLLWSTGPEREPRAVMARLHPGPHLIDASLTDRRVVGLQPYSQHPLVAVDPATGDALIVRRELQRAVFHSVFSVTRISQSADTLFHTERIAPRVPVTDAELFGEAVRLARHPELKERYPEARIRRLMADGFLYAAPLHPPVEAVFIGLDGTIWLRLSVRDEGRARWDVLSAAGAPVRTVWIDESLRPFAAAGDRAWAVERKDGAVSVVYELRP